MKKFLLLIVLAIGFAFIACNKSNRSERAFTETNGKAENVTSAERDNSITGNAKDEAITTSKTASTKEKASTEPLPEKTPDKIIRNANARIKVNSINEVTDSIKIIAIKYKAYISNENLNNGNGNLENQIVIRVPQMYFEKLLQDVINKADYVDYKNVTADDVTSEFVDVQTRLRTKRAVLERYFELMNRASKITDLLEVEDKIRVLLEEIESMEGRLKLMNDKSAYSTITVTLYELVPSQPVPGISTASQMLSAIRNGWNNSTSFIIFLLNFWPFVIVLGGCLFYWRRKKVVKRFDWLIG